MMIGPAPMIRMLWMSVRLGTALRAADHLAAQVVLGEPQLGLQAAQHQVVEALEQRLQIVRPRARLGMALEAERRPILEGDALERAVEQRAVRRLDPRRQSRLIDREAVILAGDEHPPRLEV